MNTSQKLQPSFYFGEAVDRYLESEGAIAQAVDRDKIVLSSSVFAMAEPERRTIILHELAHTEQLARTGNDPVSSLEDEAWEAAEAWSEGKPFQIRGRARTRLNATAIIQGGEHGKMASGWYTSNPVEPIGKGSNVTVKNTVLLDNSDSNPATLEDFLDAIIQKNDKQVVIVCHGSEESLAIPLFKGTQLGAWKQNITRLLSDHPSEKDGIKAPVFKDEDVFYGENVAAATRLRGKMNQVRKMNLEHVAFRACDMGVKVETLEAFRDFFGAASVSAPQLLDSYGTVTASIGSDVAGWLKIHKKTMHRAWSYKDVAFGLKSIRQSHTPKYQILCRAVTKNALISWIQTHVGGSLANDSFRYHGMVDVKVADKDASIIYFIRDQAFLSNIVYYAG